MDTADRQAVEDGIALANMHAVAAFSAVVALCTELGAAGVLPRDSIERIAAHSIGGMAHSDAPEDAVASFAELYRRRFAEAADMASPKHD